MPTKAYGVWFNDGYQRVALLLGDDMIRRLRRPVRADGGTPTDLSVGADVIVAARLASVVFLVLFILWAAVPHKALVGLVLAVGVLNHIAWWVVHVRGRRRITAATARLTLLSDTIGIGIAVILTGGADSPAVLVWAPNVAVAAIWLGVRGAMPVLGVVLAFLLGVGLHDPGVALHLTQLQYAVFAAFMLALIVAHGGVVAARQRSALSTIAAAEARSRQDPLTGLANRWALDEQLPLELDRALRYGSSLAVMMIDLDDFKTINDTQGHLAGDAVLIDVAGHLIREKRRSDTVVRLGGEEFVMLLPETDECAAVSLAERLRQRVCASAASQGATISIGVASFPRSAQSDRTLIRAADEALYAAKRMGKNQTVLFEPDGVADIPSPSGGEDAPAVTR